LTSDRPDVIVDESKFAGALMLAVICGWLAWTSPRSGS